MTASSEDEQARHTDYLRPGAVLLAGWWEPTQRIIALFLFLCFGPLLVACGLCIWVTLGQPVIFRQLRAGRDGVPFEIYKFRTMLPPSSDRTTDDARLTRLGRVLRAFSLDELPTLINVMRGEMLMVGPRPLLPEYTDRYSAEQRVRLCVKPGLTGWAQINGRNLLSWEERFSLDAWYVANRSVRLDCMIMIKTVSTVLDRSGVSHPGHATMPAFNPRGDELPDQKKD